MNIFQVNKLLVSCYFSHRICILLFLFVSENNFLLTKWATTCPFDDESSTLFASPEIVVAFNLTFPLEEVPEKLPVKESMPISTLPLELETWTLFPIKPLVLIEPLELVRIILPLLITASVVSIWPLDDLKIKSEKTGACSP